MKNSLQDSIYNDLRKKIIDFELVPGTLISVYDISKDMGISRTPVREAFIRLAGESLVEIQPQRKSNVSLIDMQRVSQECFFRVGLEQANYSLFMPLCNERHINALKIVEERLVSHIAKHNIAGALDLDDIFHKIPFIVTGQMLSWNEINQMNGHYHRMRNLILRFDEHVTGMLNDHAQLIDAFQHHDLEMARTVLGLHCKLPRIQEAFPEFFKPTNDVSS